MTKKSTKKKCLFFLLILLLTTILSFLWKQNFHKNIYLESIIYESNGTIVTNTFETRMQHQRGIDYKKDNYEKKGNEVFLRKIYY